MGLALTFVGREGFGLGWVARFWRPLVAAGARALVLGVGSLGLLSRIAVGGLVYLAVLTAVGGLRFRRNALPVLSV